MGSDEAAVWGGKTKSDRFFIPAASGANLVTVARQGGLANAMKAAGRAETCTPRAPRSH